VPHEILTRTSQSQFNLKDQSRVARLQVLAGLHASDWPSVQALQDWPVKIVDLRERCVGFCQLTFDKQDLIWQDDEVIRLATPNSVGVLKLKPLARYYTWPPPPQSLPDLLLVRAALCLGAF
jgi:hypothetical protein